MVLKLLQDTGDIHKPVGRDVIGVLLAQDLAVVPMIIVLALLEGEGPSGLEVAMQVVGGLGLVSFVVWVTTRENPKLPGEKLFRADHELQVFAALAICFGLGFLSGVMGLSAALGAFAGGILVASFKQTDWVHRRLDPFRIVFVGSFFLSVGMLIDLNFLKNQWQILGVLVAAALVTNTLLNAIALRFLGRSWPTSFYGGAMLAPIGEFSFVLAAIGHQTSIITDYATRPRLP